jgi:hypothetical protein
MTSDASERKNEEKSPLEQVTGENDVHPEEEKSPPERVTGENDVHPGGGNSPLERVTGESDVHPEEENAFRARPARGAQDENAGDDLASGSSHQGGGDRGGESA